MFTNKRNSKLIIVVLALIFVTITAWAAFCPYCGQELAEDFTFCPGCGKSLAGVPGLRAGEQTDRRDTGAVERREEQDEKGRNWYTRSKLPDKRELDRFIAAPNSLLVDFENAELINKDSSYSLFQVDALDDMYGRQVAREMDHLSPNGKKYWIYKVANVSVEKYENHQVGKWQIVAGEADDDYRLITREGIILGMELNEARDRMRDCSYKFHKEKSKNKQRVLYYKKSRRFKTDYFIELWFSPGENKLQKIRYGTLGIN